jgi:hypothetical protein
MHEPVSTWVHFFGQPSFAGAKDILHALEYAGIKPHLNKPEAPNGLGVLCFDAISSELCDYLRMVSHGGAVRVLAVASPDATVTPADLWPVLQAGASDAFLWNRMPNPAAHVAARFERWQAVDRLVESPLVKNNLIGNSVIWKSILRQIVEVAYFTDASVLILGERGSFTPSIGVRKRANSSSWTAPPSCRSSLEVSFSDTNAAPIPARQARETERFV